MMHKPNTTITIRRTTFNKLAKLRKVVGPKTKWPEFIESLARIGECASDEHWDQVYTETRKAKS